MKRTAKTNEAKEGQMLFTYRRTISERLASGELRDVTVQARAAGFRWPLAASELLSTMVDQVPPAHRHEETVSRRWQHIFLLASAAAAQMGREGGSEKEINVVLRSSNAPDRSREHIKTLLLRRERSTGDDAPDQFALSYKGE